ncbi:MAG: ribose 1,5-bisphosphate isomerase [Candidatus Woesearchaeota archaeon]|nr:ribose 1,5-bisphosphate isomerase [Candidatus Woesearchaeota archaeon]
MKFEEIVNKIKTLEIQGAEVIAQASVNAILSVLEEIQDWEKDKIIKKLNSCKETLIKTRPTEPAMVHSLNYLLDFKSFPDFKKMNSVKLSEEIIKRANFIIKHFSESDEIIAEIGSKKIKKNYIVYIHCHSSTVMRILKRAWDKGTKFEVYLTETRPHYQGRKSAKELSEYGIPVTYFVDSAARFAIKKADIMLIGADAITNDGKVINKVGSEMFAIIANKYDVPVYSCTNSWKYDPESRFGYDTPIEEGRREDFWKDAPEKVKINTHLFDKVDAKLISGIISELGIYPPEILIEEVKRKYSWFFEKY